MYAHQAVEQYIIIQKHIIDQYKKNHGNKEVANSNLFANEINNAAHYHFGQISDIEQIVNTDELFSGEYGADIKMPYPKCWYDYDTKIGKGGIFAMEIGPDLLLIDLYVCVGGQWLPNPYQAYIGLGEDVRRLVEADNQISIDDIQYRELSRNIWLTFSGDASMDFDSPTVEPIEYLPEFKEHLRYFNLCLLLLSCKNIATIMHPAPDKLNKKRLKSGKPPLNAYKTLKLVLPRGGKNKDRAQSRDRATTRLHMVSGHFKIYTKAAPLFGQLTGRYWWQPQIRGNKASGTINKQYRVEVKK